MMVTHICTDMQFLHTCVRKRFCLRNLKAWGLCVNCKKYSQTKMTASVLKQDPNTASDKQLKRESDREKKKQLI